MTGTALRTLRTQAGMSQRALAKRLKVHWNTLARWERGELPIRGVVALSIQSVCAVVPPPAARKGGPRRKTP
jgi:transcriptional regulator with XRE-family HTH domain